MGDVVEASFFLFFTTIPSSDPGWFCLTNEGLPSSFLILGEENFGKSKDFAESESNYCFKSGSSLSATLLRHHQYYEI